MAKINCPETVSRHSSYVTKLSSTEAAEGNPGVCSKRDTRSRHAEMLHALGKSTTESDITEGFIDFAAKYRISLVRYRNVHFVYTSPKCSPLGGGLYSSAGIAEKGLQTNVLVLYFKHYLFSVSISAFGLRLQHGLPNVNYFLLLFVIFVNELLLSIQLMQTNYIPSTPGTKLIQKMHRVLGLTVSELSLLVTNKFTNSQTFRRSTLYIILQMCSTSETVQCIYGTGRCSFYFCFVLCNENEVDIQLHSTRNVFD